MRCTRPGSNQGSNQRNYLARFFLPRRLRVLTDNFRFGALVPRFLPVVFARFDLLMVFVLVLRRVGPELPRIVLNARNAVEDNGDLRPCRNVQTGAFRSGSDGVVFGDADTGENIARWTGAA